MTRTVALLVNPVAGIGGAAGLGGSDGAAVQAAAATRGGVSHAAERAQAVLAALAPRWADADARLLVAPGVMGETVAAAAGVPYTVVQVPVGTPTSAGDTTRCAAAFADLDVDLLLFAGGDGTAADVARGCGERIRVLGIPSGVKMYSGCFAVSPRAAADIADAILASKAGRAHDDSMTVEVVDLDEAALREGRVSPRLTGALRVPVARAVQTRKAPTARNAAGQVRGVVVAAAGLLADGRPTALGPGGTMHAVTRYLGIDGTVLGVDIVGGTELLAANVSERELFGWASRGDLRIVASVIGGQGFLFGRGNQQFSPRVLRAVGARNIVILAPEAKLAALAGRPLLVDSGDPTLDVELAGYRRVLTGPGQWAIYPVGDINGTATDLDSIAREHTA